MITERRKTPDRRVPAGICHRHLCHHPSGDHEEGRRRCTRCDCPEFLVAPLSRKVKAKPPKAAPKRKR